MTNHLVRSQSLYLRKHAENPIDWFPWDDLALETARSQDKPIFLSIGYSSCHWCTVMEHEAFSDSMIADYMNANFVAIKVDREERPDLDSIYMQAVQIMGEQGGWPLNLFLAPDDLVPFFGGTYFPIEPRYGRPGFLKVLHSIVQIYHHQRQEIQSFKGQIIQNLTAANQLSSLPTINDRALFAGIAKCAEIVVSRKQGTCFPMIPYADLVLRASRFDTLNPELQPKARQRGFDLAMGGIFDHVAGGWHRYTVDPTWTVPHFEKMLYDNGQIMEYLANLWASGAHEPAIERAIAKTATWLQREMLTAEGYFYASQDADSEGKEGKFWVWSYGELRKLFSDSEFQELTAAFTITPRGNYEEANVLQRLQAGKLSAVVESCLDRLFRGRYGEYSRPSDAFPVARNLEDVKNIEWAGRVPPVTDTKMIVAWNALMISGLAAAYRVFRQDIYRQLAVNAADFILENQWLDDRLQRLNYDGIAMVAAQAEDYALLIKALLDLHQACPELGDRYLIRAEQLQIEFDRYFWDRKSGGYFNTASDRSKQLLIRERNYQDNATPSANGIAIANLVRLSLLTQNLEYLNKVEFVLKVFGEAIENTPIVCPSLLTALDWFRNHTLIHTTLEQFPQLQQQYHPLAVFKLVEHLPTPDAIALVCQDFTCFEPVTSLEMLQRQLLGSQTRIRDQ
jgi:uncharacterized protein